jgi:hypothetical protein
MNGCARWRPADDDTAAGDPVYRVGGPVTYWFGVVEGLLKMSSDNAQGASPCLPACRPAATGEGTALEAEPYRYNIRRCAKRGGQPPLIFPRRPSIGFNRFDGQLSAWVEFISTREIDRMSNPTRVGQPAALFNRCFIRAWEGAAHHAARTGLHLVGLSRQR